MEQTLGILIHEKELCCTYTTSKNCIVTIGLIRSVLMSNMRSKYSRENLKIKQAMKNKEGRAK